MTKQIMKYMNYKNITITWALISLLSIILSTVIFLYTQLGKTFFALLNVINFLMYLFVLILKNKILALIERLENDFEKINKKATEISINIQYKYEFLWGTILISLVTIFGILAIFISVTDVKFYYSLIKEDGIIEYGSAICWLLAAVVLVPNIYKRIRFNRKSSFSIIPHVILLLFFIVCAGEEISWGQRILGITTPELLGKINVQNETNLHNIGSISIFSNLFFILNLLFFLLLPFLTKKYTQLMNYLYYYSFPLPNRTVISVFLISLFIWSFIGIRFGTLGFHPFSFFAENYYSQMDDEIFEFLSAYSFFVFAVMNGLIKPAGEVYTAITEGDFAEECAHAISPPSS